MNGVSDVKLAIACCHAGILPSLVLVERNYFVEGIFDVVKFDSDLSEYSSKTDNGPILIACDVNTLARPDIFALFVKYNVSVVEILNCEAYNVKEMYRLVIKAKEHGITVTPKILAGFDSVNKICEKIGMLDCVTIKGPNGAGRGIDDIVLEDEVVKIRDNYPDMTIIASGGINTGQDIKKMLDLGVDWVSMGTIFCASEESSVSLTTKQKLILSSQQDVTRLTTGATQKALVFSKSHERDINNTAGLLDGLSTGTSGHIFAGTGIDHIDKIEPVKDIVNKLVKYL